MYQQEPGEYPRNWILRVLDQGVQNIRIDRQEFTYLGVIFRDMGMGKLDIR